MVISFYYGGKLVGQTTTTCPDGCRLSLSQPGLPGGKLYGPEGLELVRFPPADAIPSERQRQVTRKLFGHLERGVLLHSSRQGLLVKRLCQGRVFYSGNAALGRDGPNKLERDEVVKVFDTSQFFRGPYRRPCCPQPGGPRLLPRVLRPWSAGTSWPGAGGTLPCPRVQCAGRCLTQPTEDLGSERLLLCGGLSPRPGSQLETQPQAPPPASGAVPAWWTR